MEAIVSWEMVRNSPLGTDLNEEQCAALAHVASMHCLGPGDFLISEGDKDHSLHIVVRGAIAVVKQTGGGDWVTLQVLREQDMAGELSFIDGLEHSASLRSLGDSEVFSLESPAFEGLVEKDPQLVYSVMRNIVRTVHGILRRMNIQYVELTNYITKQHGRY
jgi:CRP/FNR family cyclic AMP-dependent transcriptional regulator